LQTSCSFLVHNQGDVLPNQLFFRIAKQIECCLVNPAYDVVRRCDDDRFIHIRQNIVDIVSRYRCLLQFVSHRIEDTRKFAKRVIIGYRNRFPEVRFAEFPNLRLKLADPPILPANKQPDSDRAENQNCRNTAATHEKPS
jgi:hypothetical protein